jgi:cell division septation protein DedD
VKTDRRRSGESGQGALFLLIVFAVLLAVFGITFLARMHLQHRLAGGQLQALAARYVAEAGVAKAMWYLEGRAPNGSDDASWRPHGYSEELQADGLRGRYTLEIDDAPGGTVAITSWGEAGTAGRGVRVIAKISPRALGYALFSGGLVTVEGQRAKVVLAGPEEDGCVPRTLAGLNAEFWFRTPGSTLALMLSCAEQRPAARLGIANLDRLTVGELHQPAGIDRLQSFGVHIVNADQVATRRIAPEALPSLDADAFRRGAAANPANADLNHAAGRAFSWPSLLEKKDSLYTAEEFSLILRYLRDRNVPMAGAVFAAGPATVPADAPLTILDGFLATDGGLTVAPGGSLTVRHQRGQLLPGLVTLTRETYAPIVVGERARVAVDGLVVAQGVIEVREGATVDVAGGIVAADSDYGLRLFNASLTVRYNPAVAGTPGIVSRTGPRKVVPLSWHEVPSAPATVTPLAGPEPPAAAVTPPAAPEPAPAPPAVVAPSPAAVPQRPNPDPRSGPAPAALQTGTAREVRPAHAVPSPGSMVGRPEFHVQAGAFKNREYADDLVRRLRAHGYTVALVKGPLIRVWVGPPMSQEAAERFAAHLRLNGFEAILSPARVKSTSGGFGK